MLKRSWPDKVTLPKIKFLMFAEVGQVINFSASPSALIHKLTQNKNTSISEIRTVELWIFNSRLYLHVYEEKRTQHCASHIMHIYIHNWVRGWWFQKHTRKTFWLWMWLKDSNVLEQAPDWNSHPSPCLAFSLCQRLQAKQYCNGIFLIKTNVQTQTDVHKLDRGWTWKQEERLR